MNSKVLVCILVALFCIHSARSQVVFEAELGNDFNDFTGWDCSNAKQVTNTINNKDYTDFQLGTATESGYAITPSLPLSSVKTPAAVVTFHMKVYDTSAKLNVSVLNGETEIITEFSNNQAGWDEKTFRITGGNDQTKIKFETNGTSDKRVLILKLKIEQDNVFYESFSNITNSSGNNNYNGYALTGVVKADQLDNREAYSNAICADHCIFVNNNERYTTHQFSLTADAVLSFRAAGDIDRSSSINLYYVKTYTDKTSIDETFSTEKGKWNTYRTIIGSSKSYVSLAGKNYFLDDVAIYYPLTATLNDNVDNTDLIAEQKDEIIHVTVNRTLPAGQWCTLCLPFDISQESIRVATGIDNEAAIRTLNRVENGTFYFDRVTSVSAGTPFLIKLAKTLANPTFKLVTVSATEPTNNVNDEGYGFAGTFSPITLKSDGSNAFLSAPDAQGNQYIYTPAAGNSRMNGLRAYFVLPEKSKNARIHIADADELSGISEHKQSAVSPAASSIYDVSGRRLTSPRQNLTKGLYIINGKKTIIR